MLKLNLNQNQTLKLNFTAGLSVEKFIKQLSTGIKSGMLEIIEAPNEVSTTKNIKISTPHRKLINLSRCLSKFSLSVKLLI